MRKGTNQNIAVYILCGGKSTRMKTEKGLVEFQGKTFLQWILEAVHPLTENITLVTKNKAYSKFGLPMISDFVEEKGPVGGIFTALTNSQAEYNLILSCDIPRITTVVISALLESAVTTDFEATILTDGVHDYPLIGCYRKSSAPIFEEAIFLDHLKLCPLVNSIPNHKILVSPQNHSTLYNINTEEELQMLNS
jgi:molybdopterin-guanine dinucleotide biosynthesis protein A